MKFDNVIAEMGFNYQKPFAYGTHRGYDVTLRTVLAQDIFTFFIGVEDPSPSQATEFGTFAVDTKKTLRIQNHAWNHHLLVLNWRLSALGFLKTETVRTFLDAVTIELGKLGILPGQTCVFCNQKDAFVPVKIDGLAFRCHQECKDKEIAVLKEKQQAQPVLGKNTLASLFGAFVGAVIGALPWILVDIFLDFYASVLGFLIGFSALYFFKLFGGHVTPKTKYLILAATIFGVIAANISYASYMIWYLDGALVLENYVVCYTDADLAPVLWTDLGLGLLMAAFSLPALYSKVRTLEKKAVEIA